MTDIAITVEKLSKCYLVGHNAAQSEGYTALRDVLSRSARNLARKTHDMLSGRAIVQGDEVEEFWALKDVSFEIKQGDRVGIIGRNGAGKSTLLKILSRITEPTTGRIKISGRVASLLEVGTGFHPELSGRENIFLNGAILGMKRAEIQRRFDEIVAFAEVEKFLDTPVKRYSSGMYVRLAFAVAAHLEPEILVVDEVLAVGDATFQEKCLGRMNELAGVGRTVIFVSHNIGAIKQLCTKALLLQHGRAEEFGAVAHVVNTYHDSGYQQMSRFVNWPLDRAPGNADVRLVAVRVGDSTIDMTSNLPDKSELSLEFDLEASAPIKAFSLSCVLRNGGGDCILHTESCIHNASLGLLLGRNHFAVRLPANLLRQGKYFVRIAGHVPYVNTYFDVVDAVGFSIETRNPEILRYPDNAWRGPIGPAIAKWHRNNSQT